jgi:exonuclease SbcC
MKLHRLEVTAFGPFADTVEVDFDALGADGLFLLHGQTGAGKTTILDAIAFALYGRVPGSRGEAKRLHSDHASPQTPPRVVLEATIGGRRLRLERTPEFLRPKKRGEGETKENAKATLTWQDNSGRHLSRLEEIGEEIGKLLGMSADQFFQVVLLPQGDFDRFLSADNEDRERLLERLFDTARFGTAETWLAEQRRIAWAELSQRQQSVDRIAGKIEVVARVGAVADPLEAVDWAQQLLADAKDELAAADADVTRCRAEFGRAQTALTDVRRVAELCRRRDLALAQQAEFDAGAAQRAGLAEELRLARQAAPVRPALADVTGAEAAAARHAAAVNAAADRLAALSGGIDAAADGSDIDAEIHRWSGEVGALDALAADAADSDRLTGELAEHAAERDRLREEIAGLTDSVARLPAAAAELDDRLRRAADAEAALPGLIAEHDHVRQAASAAAELVEQRRVLARCATAAEAARAAHLDARERLVGLRERRLAGMAAELAAELVTGEPCAVCGSPEHPAPARAGGDLVTKAEEDAAGAAEQRAAVAAERAAARLADARRAVDLLHARSGDDSPEELAVAARDGGQRLARARERAAQRAELARQREQLRATESEQQERLRDCESRLGASAERIDAIGVRLAQLRAKIASAVGADGTIERRRRRLGLLTAAAVDLREVRAGAAAAATAVTAAEQRLAEAVARAGFVRTADAISAWRDPWRHSEIEAELAAAERAGAHAAAVLAEPEIQGVADATGADLAESEAVAARAHAEFSDAVAAHGELTRRTKDLENLGAELWAAVSRIAPMQSRYTELAALADVVAGRGENSRRMSLRSYVLAARLEEVALAGSLRLSRMSGGRYEFVHSDAAGPRGRRGGLGLDIRDDYTGQIRPSKTLSGGEKFMASLALALGLADTVTAESGGVVLNTMFIDEGFGSLDGAALDQVMAVLDELRAGGRVVGVVSHVDEMRQRIPTRLHVVRDRRGSRLEMTAAV